MPFSVRLSRVVFCAALALAFGTQTIGSAAAPIVMKLGTPTVNDYQVQWLKFFKAAVEKNSNNRIEVQIYPNSQLGSAPRMIEGVQFNSIQGLVMPPEFLVGVDPRYQMLAAPAIFSSVENIDKTLADKDFHAALAEIGLSKGLVLAAAWGLGAYQVYTRRPVKRLADLTGMKIRVLAGPIDEKQVDLFGATGVPMPLDQVMPAVQQGALDGIMLSVTTAQAFKFYTMAKYGTELRQSYVNSVALLSKIFLDGLPPDLRKIVLDAGESANREIIPWSKDYVTRSYAEWASNGGEMAKLPKADLDEEHAKLKDVGAEVFRSSPAAAKMYKLMVDTAAKNR